MTVSSPHGFPCRAPLSLLLRLGLATTVLASGACRNVEYYEKADLSRPLMAFETDATESHWMQKVVYSMEGSAGGMGGSAGGGCGCY